MSNVTIRTCVLGVDAYYCKKICLELGQIY